MKINILQGTVIKYKIQGMLTVSVIKQKFHKKYKKIIKKKKKYIVQNNKYDTEVGDKVIIYNIIPKSKLKRWSIFNVLKKKNDTNGDKSKYSR